MLHTDVAEGVHRIEDAHTNWHPVEGDAGRLTVVGARVPRSPRSLREALRALGRRREDVEAVVLTHAHSDHVGFAERARTSLGVPVYVRENDVPLTRHPLQHGHERARTASLVTQPRAMPTMAALTRSGACGRPR